MSEVLTFAAKVTAEGRNIRGAVQLAGQRNKRGGEWVEVDPKALMSADATKTIGVWEHDDGKLLGTFDNGTLEINRTPEGIEYLIRDLPNTTYANDALELVRGGYVTGSSFRIEGYRSKFSVDPKTGERTRRINHIDQLADVSPVQNPFFEASQAIAFSKGDDVADETQTAEVDETPAAPPKREGAFSKGPETADGPKVTRDDLYEATLAFARELDNDALKAHITGAWAEAGDNPDELQTKRIDAFTKAIEERRVNDATTAENKRLLKFKRDMILGITPKAPEAQSFSASSEYEEAFWAYAVSTPEDFAYNSARLKEMAFAQTISGSGAEGGFTVPDGFVTKLTMRLKDFGGIASAAQEITTTNGESLRWPYIDDTANKAVIAAEDTAAASGADLVFDSVELGAYEYDATGAGGTPIEVSLPLLQDSAFDIEDLLLKVLSQRIGRKQADHFATGAGGTEPVGLFAKAADTMTATVASLAAPEQIFQVDRAYRDNARWVMSDTTLAKLWSAQATTNEPLFQPGRTMNGRPFDVLFGYPITIDNSAGNFVAFGDINAGYIIRRVRGVQLLVDPYTPNARRAVRYHAWARADGNIQDPNAYSVSSWSGVSADT